MSREYRDQDKAISLHCNVRTLCVGATDALVVFVRIFSIANYPRDQSGAPLKD